MASNPFETGPGSRPLLHVRGQKKETPIKFSAIVAISLGTVALTVALLSFKFPFSAEPTAKASTSSIDSILGTPLVTPQVIGLNAPAKLHGYVQCPPSWLPNAPCKTTFKTASVGPTMTPRGTPITFRLENCRSGRSVGASATMSPSMVITGNNIELTDSIAAYTNDKLGQMVKKYKDFVKSTEVHFTINKNPSAKESAHRVEVTVYVKDSKVIRGSVSSVSEYSSIDLVTDLINRKLRKFKERKTNKRASSGGVRTFYTHDISDSGSDMEPVADVSGAAAMVQGEDDVQGEYQEVPDGYSPSSESDIAVVRRKKFPMPPISIDDATLCLDYLDHDFYVFRNKDTNEINVVYRRQEGGVGLIEPEQA